jgi:hypothetical protein
MKKVLYWLLFLAAIPLSAQDLKVITPGDFDRSGWIISGQIGIGMEFGLRQRQNNQNNRIYLSANAFVGFVESPFDGLGKRIRRFGHKGYAEMSIRMYRNWALYNQRSRMRWTFNPELELGYGIAFEGTFKMEAAYSLMSFYNTGYFRKLSNANGQFKLTAGDYYNNFGGKLFWRNDKFGLPLFGDNIQSDHGETQTIGATIYHQVNTGSTTQYFEDFFMEYTYQGRMITDRRIYLESGDNQATYGRYAILEDSLTNSFHYYETISVGAKSNFGNIGLTGGIDDLIKGRNIQRFAHQYFLHRAYEDRPGLFKGSPPIPSPLYPWEERKAFYLMPKYLLDADIRFHNPYVPFKI